MRIAIAVAACTFAAAFAGCGTRTSAFAAGSAPSVTVARNQLVDASGKPLRLLGVDRSGTEYACIQGWGIFDGPSDAASIAAMAAWHINAVRLPLNEDCWLGINGSGAFTGAIYRNAIQQYVALLHSAGMVAILDLHWAAPAGVAATQQLPMPDADHAPAFWSSVAATFRDDHSVMFDLFNEPYVNSGNAITSDPWACWRDGCTIDAGSGISSAWQAAGMQSLVNAVRSAGAAQPVLLGGLAWSNDLTGWIAHRPADPANETIASLHMYNFNSCATMSCWSSEVAPVAAVVPIVTGELGENDCAGGFIDSYMNWADAEGISYLGWTWDTWDCRSGPALIASYDGTPTAFGTAFRDHLAQLGPQLLTTPPDPPPAQAGAPSPAAVQTVSAPGQHEPAAVNTDAARPHTVSHRSAAMSPWLHVR